MTAPGVSFGERSSPGPGDFGLSGDDDGLAELDGEALGQLAPALRGLAGARDRIGTWRGLLDRPLTSYYLVLGITALLLGLGLVMVESTTSVADLTAGLPPLTDFKKQLLGAVIGLPLMWAGGALVAAAVPCLRLPAGRGLGGRARAHANPRRRRL